VPSLAEAFARRGWPLPAAIDRVYDRRCAVAALGWQPRFGWAAVLAQLDDGDAAVAPPAATPAHRAGEACLG
jgi:UDP-glucose 4-epimerase